MGIVVLGAVFVDIKGYPTSTYIPGGRNVGRVEQVPGGVSRNVVEDIANVELRPTFVSLVDDTGLGADVVRQLKNHKVNTDYVLPTPDGMGTWLAVFDNQGDVCAAISKRPDLRPLIALLDERGTRSSGTPTASPWRSTWTRRSSSGCSSTPGSTKRTYTPWCPT